MLEVRPGSDPYVFYKMGHVDRARTAWILSEEFGLYEALRDGPASVEEVTWRLGLQARAAAGSTTTRSLGPCSSKPRTGDPTSLGHRLRRVLPDLKSTRSSPDGDDGRVTLPW